MNSQAAAAIEFEWSVGILDEMQTRQPSRRRVREWIRGGCLVIAALTLSVPALAGPPFLSDDPAPTPYEQYEIYVFANGARTSSDVSGNAGIDFNYGATPDLQLTVVVPVSYEDVEGQNFSSGLGNVELAAKYRFLHQESIGWDVAFFPRLFLPAGSDLGDKKASLLLPIWLGKEMGDWSTFGGAGVQLTQGAGSKDSWVAGWALTYRILPDLLIGAEIFHQSPDSTDGGASTTLGFGGTYDINENVHLLSYIAAGLQNTDETGDLSWYASILFTF